MKRYFKGNTKTRNNRMKKIHAKFKQHQRKWILTRFAKHCLKK